MPKLYLVLGLKWSRVLQWLTCLKEADRKVGPREYGQMAWLALKGALQPNAPRWRRRMRACMRCPIYDPELKRCQPYTGSPLGCGCFMPLKALQGSCWLKDLGSRINGYSGWDD